MNMDRAWAALHYLATHKEQYNPCVWITDTQTDLAGRIVIDAGAEQLGRYSNQGTLSWVAYGGREWTVFNLATYLLRITEGEAKTLFGPRNSLQQLHRMVVALEEDKLLIGPEGRPLVACEETWTGRGSVPVLWRHRRTTVIAERGHYIPSHHESREQAHDYITDVAACRALTYHHHQGIWRTAP